MTSSPTVAGKIMVWCLMDKALTDLPLRLLEKLAHSKTFIRNLYSVGLNYGDIDDYLLTPLMVPGFLLKILESPPFKNVIPLYGPLIIIIWHKTGSDNYILSSSPVYEIDGPGRVWYWLMTANDWKLIQEEIASPHIFKHCDTWFEKLYI